jgi:hypothetical protein
MEQRERRQYLIRYLLNEQDRYQDIQIPAGTNEQKQLLRALMNVRMPQEISEEFLSVQDDYLAEAVRQKDVTATLTEFFIKIIVTYKKVPEECFRGRNIYIAVFPACTARVPITLCYIFFKLFELFRIIFLHKLISVGTFKIKNILRVPFEKLKIPTESVRNIFAHCGFKIPIPHSIKMSGCYGMNMLCLIHKLTPKQKSLSAFVLSVKYFIIFILS